LVSEALGLARLRSILEAAFSYRTFTEWRRPHLLTVCKFLCIYPRYEVSPVALILLLLHFGLVRNTMNKLQKYSISCMGILVAPFIYVASTVFPLKAPSNVLPMDSS